MGVAQVVMAISAVTATCYIALVSILIKRAAQFVYISSLNLPLESNYNGV